MSRCRLQLIRHYPFDISKQSNPMALNYTCFTDASSAKQLEIIDHGFRYISHNHQKRLIMVVLDQKLKNAQGEIIIMVPFTIYRYFSATFDRVVTISRQPIGLLSPLLPKIQASKEVNVYFNSNFRADQSIIKFLSSCDFICQTGDYFIDCQWLKSFLPNFRSIRSKLEWQRAISQRKNGRFVDYLRVFIQLVERKGEARLFRKGQTKLNIKQQPLHPYSTYRTIQLKPLELQIMHQQRYEQAFDEMVRDQIRNELIVLETEKDIGIQAFLHYFAQKKLNSDFKCIDCEKMSSTKEFWMQIQSMYLLQNAVVFIRNLPWVEQLYQSQQISGFEIKNIIKRLQKYYNEVLDKTVRKYCVLIEHIGQNSVHEFFQNARSIQLKLSKSDKSIIFDTIFSHFAPDSPLANQIVHQFHDKFGWQVFYNFMAESWTTVKQLSTSHILKRLRELVKQEQVQNLIEVSWDDVGGLETAKEEIIQTVLLPIKHPEIFDERIRPRTGLLFYGPPGTGKTLLGKCVAKECKMSFISVKGPQLLNMYVGESEKNVRAVFQRARACSPCIVFMDELDALIPKRGNSGDSNQVMDRIVAELLQQMDTASQNQVFVIGATNRPDLLDPSIMRGGRFDKQIYLGITQAPQDRIKIIKAQTRHLTLDQHLNWERILNHVPINFTGADFYGLTSKAVMAAAQRTIEQYQNGQRRDKIVLVEQDFITAASGIKSSVTEADLARYEQLRKVYS